MEDILLKQFGDMYMRALLDRKYLVSILDDIAVSTDLPIADIGCGSGGSTKTICECFPNASVIGIDSNQEMLQFAHSVFHNSQVNFLHANAMNLPFQDGQIACCVSRMMIDNMPQPNQVVSEMYRVLCENGVMVIYGNSSTTIGGNSRIAGLSAKMIQSFQRYRRLTGFIGFDISYIQNQLLSLGAKKVAVKRIVKDVNSPGRIPLRYYYGIEEFDANKHLYCKLKLMDPKELAAYNLMHNSILLDKNEYASFEQAIVVAYK